MSFLGEQTRKLSPYLPTILSGGFSGVVAGAALANPEKTKELATDMVRNTAKAGVQLTVQNPALAEVAGAVGGEKARSAVLKPRNVPGLGVVKPLSARPSDVTKNSAQTPGETGAQAANIFLEAGAPGVGRAAKGLFSGAKKAVGPFSQWAERFSNVPARVFEKASDPAMAKAIKDVRERSLGEGPEGLLAMGEDVYSKAKEVKKSAGETYAALKGKIINEKGQQIIQRSKQFVDNVKNTLTENKIKFGDEGIYLTGSQF